MQNLLKFKIFFFFFFCKLHLMTKKTFLMTDMVLNCHIEHGLGSSYLRLKI